MASFMATSALAALANTACIASTDPSQKFQPDQFPDSCMPSMDELAGAGCLPGAAPVSTAMEIPYPYHSHMAPDESSSNSAWHGAAPMYSMPGASEGMSPGLVGHAAGPAAPVSHMAYTQHHMSGPERSMYTGQSVPTQQYNTAQSAQALPSISTYLPQFHSTVPWTTLQGSHAGFSNTRPAPLGAGPHHDTTTTSSLSYSASTPLPPPVSMPLALAATGGSPGSMPGPGTPAVVSGMVPMYMSPGTGGGAGAPPPAGGPPPLLPGQEFSAPYPRLPAAPHGLQPHQPMAPSGPAYLGPPHAPHALLPASVGPGMPGHAGALPMPMPGAWQQPMPPHAHPHMGMVPHGNPGAATGWPPGYGAPMGSPGAKHSPLVGKHDPDMLGPGSRASVASAGPTVDMAAGTPGVISPMSARVLREWVLANFENPFPSKLDASALAQQAGVSVKRLRVWLKNERARFVSVWRAKRGRAPPRAAMRELYLANMRGARRVLLDMPMRTANEAAVLVLQGGTLAEVDSLLATHDTAHGEDDMAPSVKPSAASRRGGEVLPAQLLQHSPGSQASPAPHHHSEQAGLGAESHGVLQAAGQKRSRVPSPRVHPVPDEDASTTSSPSPRSTNARASAAARVPHTARSSEYSDEYTPDEPPSDSDSDQAH